MKTRTDHETHNMPKIFWEDVAETMNGSAEDNPSPLEIVLSSGDVHSEEFDSLDLNDSDTMDAVAIKKKLCCCSKFARSSKPI